MADTAVGSRTVLVALATQQLLMAYDSTAMNVALSDIVTDLHTTLTGVQSAISLYALVMAALMLTGSELGTRRGFVRIFTLGAIVYGTGALLTAFSPNLPVMLFAWSLLEGIGAALVLPAILSIATQRFDGPARTRALAVIGAATGVGAALGPILCGVIATYVTWRLSFLMETVVTAMVVLMMRRTMETRRERSAQRFDVVGMVLSALGFGLIVLATLLIGKYGAWTARQDVVVGGTTLLEKGQIAPTVPLAAAGLVVLTGFAWWERIRYLRGKKPLVRVSVLRRRTTRVGSFTLLAQYLVTAGLMFLVPVFVQTSLGYNALESGVTLLPTTVLLIVAALAATRLVGGGRVSRRALIIAGFLLMAAGAVIVALGFDPGGSGLRLAPGLAVAGIGLGLCTLLPDLVQSSAPPDQVSDVSGLSRSFSYLGQSIGVALGGALMIGVLMSALTSGVQASTTFTAQQKSRINASLERQSQVSAMSDAQLDAALRKKGVGGGARDELVRLNAGARDSGLRAAMVGMGVFALAGCVLALRIPRSRPEPTHP